MAKQWRIAAEQSERIRRLELAARIPFVVAQMLVARGIDQPEQAKSFLDPKLSDLRDPELLPGVTQAADLLHAAIQAKRSIVIYGDYDVDGMTASALLSNCIQLLGGKVTTYVPHRVDEGYGLNADALHTLKQRGAEVVVTVDCGIASVAEAALARELGLELIITDHHELADSLPDATAIVHPRLPGSTYPFAGLCGAGVAFKLAWALCQRASGAKKVSDRMREFLLQAVGLVAMGTVADVVPLVDENRVLVTHGLKSLRQAPPVGVAALMRLTGLVEKKALSAEDISFTLAPRLNALGRLNQATLGVELLSTNNTERAQALAEYANELNSSRESLERSILLAAGKQAREEFDPAADAALVLAGRGWHPGVIGIVASRLAERFHRPVILIALDEPGLKPGVGSARSVPGYNLKEALDACREHLLGYGGHAAAAGLKIAPEAIDAFRTAFVEYAGAEISAAQRVAELRIDAEVPLASLSLEVVRLIERLAPFGCGNPRPMFCASDIRLAEPPKRIGGGGKHLSLRVKQHVSQLRGVAFGNGDWADELTAVEGDLEVAFRPVINDFRGRQSVELHLCDWRAAVVEQPAGA